MTNQYYSDKEDIGYGGFSLNNIRNWIIKECLESGSPVDFFDCIYEIVLEISENNMDWSEYYE